MKFNIYKKIKELEELLFNGYKLWIFRGYTAVNKRGAEKIINDIYATLPIDVENAKQYLKSRNITVNTEDNSNIYNVLKDIDTLINKTSGFLPFALVKTKKLEQLENDLKNSLPNEIYEAEKLDC